MYKNLRPGGSGGKGVYTESRKDTNNYCLYCGEKADSREHLPSKAFLNRPYPDELSIIPACSKCNNGYSDDERYVSRFLDELRNEIFGLQKNAKSKVNILSYEIVRCEDEVHYSFDESKIINIITKLAKGHAGYIFDYLSFGAKIDVWYEFIFNMDKQQIDEYNNIIIMDDLAYEIGSRANNVVIGQNESYLIFNWNIVQENNYRFFTSISDNDVMIKIVIDELLYAEVSFKK